MAPISISTNQTRTFTEIPSVADVTAYTAFRVGTIMRDAATGAIYYVESSTDGTFANTTLRELTGAAAPTLSEVSGAAAVSTLNQLSGPTWTVGTGTNAPEAGIILNTDFISYVQEGNKRYYSMRFYIDLDSPFTFEVVGAQDVVQVSGNGFSQGSGDFASRMVVVRRIGPNVVVVDRFDANNIDMWVDLTFMAIF